jgi:hypothetical protein
MEKWEKTKRYTSVYLTGGQPENLSLMVMFFYFSKACMAQTGRPIFASRNGWSRTVNSEKTIFMKRQGSDFIMHGLFVDEKMHDIACPYL